MSGTSLDGIDAAVVVTDGETVFETGPSAYRPYTAPERETIRAAFGAWDESDAIEAASEVIETAHAELLAEFGEVDVIGFHGQTVAHDPRGRGTRQLGSGDVLATALGLPVVWDFRSADVAMGGEGAPFAPFYHFAALAPAGVGRHVAVLNLGGVGNLTWLDLAAPKPETPGAILAFDTGPANAPVDDLLRARRGLAFDAGGALARAGRPDESLVAGFLAAPYFARVPPKSLDRDDFPGLAERVAPLADEDAAATLAAIAAAAAAEGLSHCPCPPERLFVTGGGRKNPAIMAELAARCPCPVAPVEAAGLDGDMLEAQAFGYLAVRVLRGLPTSAPGTTGVPAPVAGGQVAGAPTRRNRPSFS
ncbi:MAG: anhydro-N-acetylmuramic acid kinase [Paracoccaceae bacterium]|nr:anhydro-N-acetylmuramic acid kinase [Paracoccaceae bacterium]